MTAMMDGWMDEWGVDGKVDDGWMERQTDGRADGQMPDTTQGLLTSTCAQIE